MVHLPMTLLLDEHLPMRFATFFLARGHVAHRVIDVLEAGAKDPALVAWAEQNTAIVVTSDRGFRKSLTRMPEQDRSQYRRAGRIIVPGDPTMALGRLTEVIHLIEFVFALLQQEGDQRLVMEIREHALYMER